MAKRLIPKRRRGGRRARRAVIYDTNALMALFEVDDEAGVRAELERRGITPHESAGRLFVSDYRLKLAWED